MRGFAAALALAALLAAASVAAQQPIVVRFSHVVAEDTPKGKAAAYFKKLAEERTGRAVRVEIYPNGQRYNDGNELQALQRGEVDMLAPSLAKFGPLGVREFEVFDLPYLFDNYEELHKVTEGPIGAGLLKRLAPKGIVGLAFWDNGFKQMSANKPLRKVDDFGGLKMRVQSSSKILEAQMRALGALPEVIGFSELYRALKTHAVDGAENPPSNFFTQRLQDVQKFMTLSDHGYLGYAVIANRKFWDGLPPDVRADLEVAMKEATRYANEIARQENENALAAIRSGKTDVLTLSPTEKAAWKKTLSTVHKQFASRIGPDLLQAIYRETGFQP